MKHRTRPRDRRDRNPTIEALRALAMLAEAGGVSETARRLGVSQPVISKKLQVFKDPDACGAILLRSEGRVELTEAADAVLPAIRELVARYDRIVRYLRGEETSPRVLRIGSGSFAAEHYLPTALAVLRPAFEEYRIETQVCRGRDRIVGTARGRFDLSIVTHDRSQIRQTLRDERIDDAALKVELLGRQPLCVLARRDSDPGRDLAEMSEYHPVPLQRLAGWELIGPDRQSGLRRRLEQRLRGESLYFVAEGGGWAAAKEYARHGLGVAIVPDAILVDDDRVPFVSRPLSSDFDVADYILSRRDESNPFVERARKAIQAAVRTRRPGADERQSTTRTAPR